MELAQAFAISAAGMKVQTTRLRVIAENLANAETTGGAPGADPYRRQEVTFADQIDRSSGANLVEVSAVVPDESAFPLKFDPSHPAADAQGYVKLPNVNSFVEMMDMKEAQRSYDANLQVMQVTRAMLNRTIEMLK